MIPTQPENGPSMASIQGDNRGLHTRMSRRKAGIILTVGGALTGAGLGINAALIGDGVAPDEVGIKPHPEGYQRRFPILKPKGPVITEVPQNPVAIARYNYDVRKAATGPVVDPEEVYDPGLFNFYDRVFDDLKLGKDYGTLRTRANPRPGQIEDFRALTGYTHPWIIYSTSIRQRWPRDERYTPKSSLYVLSLKPSERMLPFLPFRWIEERRFYSSYQSLLQGDLILYDIFRQYGDDVIETEAFAYYSKGKFRQASLILKDYQRQFIPQEQLRVLAESQALVSQDVIWSFARLGGNTINHPAMAVAESKTADGLALKVYAIDTGTVVLNFFK